MTFDILLHITEDSQRGRVIQEMVDAQQVTPEQVVEQIIDIGIQAQQSQLTPQYPNGKTPAELLLGLFSSPEDIALMDEVEAMAYEGRKTGTTRDIGLE